MFCQKCGRQIDGNIRFCPGCGEPVINVNAPGEDNEKAEVSRPLIIAVAVIAVIIIAMIAFILFMVISGNKSSSSDKKDDDVIVSDKDGKDDSDNDDMSESDEQTIETAAAVESADTTVEAVQTVTEAENLFVTVPTESMSLRSTPGFGDDVITELGTNVYLIYEGETQTVNDNDFYKVTVKNTGQTGYLAADYCVKVCFEYDENALGIVETKDALYTYDMMVNDLAALSLKYPDIISYEVLGTSLDGRNIYAVVLGNPDAKNHIMVQSTIHGREYMNTQLIMRMIEYYAYYYDTGTYEGVSYRDLFDNASFYIVPMVNPDGVTISQFGAEGINNSQYQDLIYECYQRDKETLAYREDSLGDMYWNDYYKDETYNRDEQGDYREITIDEYTQMWKANARGVDLNRNFDAAWESLDEKPEPSYGSYKGDYPESEPETQILVDLALQRDYQYYVSYHSKGQLIYYDTWGNSADVSSRSESLAVLLENFLKYKKVNTNNSNSTDLGGFNDWVQLSLNTAGTTIESGKHRCPLDISEFMPIWLRHRESWAMLARTLY